MSWPQQTPRRAFKRNADAIFDLFVCKLTRNLGDDLSRGAQASAADNSRFGALRCWLVWSFWLNVGELEGRRCLRKLCEKREKLISFSFQFCWIIWPTSKTKYRITRENKSIKKTFKGNVTWQIVLATAVTSRYKSEASWWRHQKLLPGTGHLDPARLMRNGWGH